MIGLLVRYDYDFDIFDILGFFVIIDFFDDFDQFDGL